MNFLAWRFALPAGLGPAGERKVLLQYEQIVTLHRLARRAMESDG
jgi:hypothetical protein